MDKITLLNQFLYEKYRGKFERELLKSHFANQMLLGEAEVSTGPFNFFILYNVSISRSNRFKNPKNIPNRPS